MNQSPDDMTNFPIVRRSEQWGTKNGTPFFVVAKRMRGDGDRFFLLIFA